ncbi:hypothetical protein HPP92_019177 [Vanilla planifolia]|uniref:Uncharacterized protein n=1 Tax=Vanilla planifolia TaxID=51239 RepID=A0A835Q5B2_VANPL|nr:hypothetical protein HPP92_019177 [Vanilla planifolia]
MESKQQSLLIFKITKGGSKQKWISSSYLERVQEKKSNPRAYIFVSSPVDDRLDGGGCRSSVGRWRSFQLDKDSEAEKKIAASSCRTSGGRDDARYDCRFAVSSDSGASGGVLVQNGFRKEMFLRDIVVGGAGDGVAVVTCNSHV